jgi:hypothetical protein
MLEGKNRVVDAIHWILNSVQQSIQKDPKKRAGAELDLPPNATDYSTRAVLAYQKLLRVPQGRPSAGQIKRNIASVQRKFADAYSGLLSIGPQHFYESIVPAHLQKHVKHIEMLEIFDNAANNLLDDYEKAIPRNRPDAHYSREAMCRILHALFAGRSPSAEPSSPECIQFILGHLLAAGDVLDDTALRGYIADYQITPTAHSEEFEWVHTVTMDGGYVKKLVFTAKT